ncbi:putative ketoreductase [Halobacteriovorax marinus SJ]|uniref:Ketoreductase n=1 Tax=Halobacteriovorax marinus (strain ATCC BAA-682 / DSM 15412 / SJ) TaxID=862908 RepID=E1X029_HALMS|nr:SDR family NAD(P)-dependent oxidoreductase [Halobacteriovorax marinus]CBW27965.1 putative ketoreductase [Halobacteriovorax marinus SJ]
MKIFITGSTTGLGELAGLELLRMGHDVIFHARNSKSQMKDNLTYVIGDFSKLEEIKMVAEQANEYGPYDAIIQNAGIYNASPDDLFIVNVLTPFILSCLIHRPKRMIFLSSSMHLNGHVDFSRLDKLNYSDSKLYATMLSNYFAKEWSDCFVNAVDPGWVPTRMGGSEATDDLKMGVDTQVWLATSSEASALVSGKYFHHLEQREANARACCIENQSKLVDLLNQRLNR